MLTGREEQVVSVEYDYIICGGGLAGCVIAERLSAAIHVQHQQLQDEHAASLQQSNSSSSFSLFKNPTGSNQLHRIPPPKRILLLEAGRADYDNYLVRIPAGLLRLFRSPFDWQYETHGEPYCHGRNIYLPRGKVLGGSSCTNAMLHFRGSAQDFDQWKIPGWTANAVLPCFQSTQHDMTGRSPEYHGHSGEWTMDEVRYQNPLSRRFLEVAEASGLGLNTDFNDWSKPQDGVGRFQVSQQNGQRVSGASAFLTKAMQRQSMSVSSSTMTNGITAEILTVRAKTMVRRIHFDHSKTARSVTYDLVGDDTTRVRFSCELTILQGCCSCLETLLTPTP
jgi:choline dehydrogenase-like flavoprotein